MEKEKVNLNISGSGSYPGGKFDNVNISGSGKITGDLSCVNFSTAGSSKIEGNVICDKLSINGSSKILGNITGKNMSINGSAKVEGGARGEKLRICGSAHIDGDIKLNKLEIYGSAHIGDDIEAEEVCIKGAMRHDHFINAESVLIEVSGSGGTVQFNEIGATTVRINSTKDRGLFQILRALFYSRLGKAIGKCIEADDIHIEYSEIDTLRGGNIVVGEGSKVNIVEYTGTITIHETAQVNEVRKVEK